MGTGKRLQVAKSSSVNPRLIDLAEESTASSTAALNEMSSSDEFSSLSGYESIGNEEDIQGAESRTKFSFTHGSLTNNFSSVFLARRKRQTEFREPELRGSGEDTTAAAAPPVDERRVAPELRAGAKQPRRQPLLRLPRLPGTDKNTIYLFL